MEGEEKVIKFGQWEASVAIRRGTVRLESMMNYSGVGSEAKDLRAYSDFCLRVFEEMAMMQFLLDTASN